MASKTTHFKGFSVVDGEIKITLKLSRFDKQFQHAQYELDGNVMNSMVPFMPMITGDFVDVTRAASAAIQGIGKVYAAYGPAGRFLYQGKTMVSVVTGSTWATKGTKKVLVSQYRGKTKAKEDLQYTKTAHPKAQAKWFDAAKKADGKSWIKQAKKTAGGGKRG
ncbi:hypothetical protein G5B19_24195 [Enterocloster clostridioformis]|jgi:hypothetical protein|uniref:hypothetical protein n=1 Tax=Enterocloster clostridioformis TaxID=1531 RepID=UPI0007406650|nr:hypothetical protein [Enterocloster clostridioformis]CUX74716.1 hypothetical protein BN3589_03938 [Clostridium sp. C105KSO14]NSD58818.1 hypothetical protein [Enterocloster clostridioformis]NSJ12821.1 hypothetical protein [Enterocloster clostridioformis]NSJ21650.1 hypothetical protein [Enterocloster clostridioformis]NSJ33539.1 hypothetical protein [Enterocloster clostridioformis]